ncbi:hypothetical protein SAMN04488697_117100 [Pseudomonas sp. 43mfcvi1.1]|nr:hypothetical protein ATJ40_117100 [Pseudomonas sp. 43mfcvi1.1]SSB99369.1 hypothetical protein SAMN04488697_117100 [Pseudomonas sp. 43mfcvi1.1]
MSFVAPFRASSRAGSLLQGYVQIIEAVNNTIHCGSEPARDAANSVQMDNRKANAANVTSNTGTVSTIPTLK